MPDATDDASFTSAARIDGVLAIEQYGVISDGRTAGLVGADGSIDWWCVPALDAPPVFDRLLDGEEGGRWSITPLGPYTARRRYREDSNVLETEFRTASGRVRVTDSLNSGHAGRLPWSELARRVEGLAGTVDLEVVVTLGGRFGDDELVGSLAPNDGVVELGPVLLQLLASDDLHRRDEGRTPRTCTLRLRTSEGSRAIVALLATDAEPLMDARLADIDRRIDRSDQQWRDWTDDLTYDGPYRDRVIRSALALKLLLFSPTGAIAAAVTTSLPEVPGGSKNYDYRLAWLRDVAYSVKALLRIGATEEAQAGFAWMMETLYRNLPALSVCYTLGGELPGDERHVDLPGYRGATPVRIGNAAREQVQLSCYGDILETAELFVRSGNHLDARTRGCLEDLAERCLTEWTRPDSGIWELPDEEHHTISKIGCWLALDRAATLADDGHLPGHRAAPWRAAATEIIAWVDEHCWSATRNAYMQVAGSERLDASLLLATRFGFPRPERLAATLEAVDHELATGALVHRYSGMPDVEGAFLATSFWRVEALAFLGEPERAAAAMDELLAITAGDLGLLAEMVDTGDHAFLGNLPQGLSHLALIHAALAIGEDTAPGGPVATGDRAPARDAAAPR